MDLATSSEERSVRLASVSVLSDMLPRFVEMQVYHAVMESIASEQSARIVAIPSASDNATDMDADLTLEMNTAQQEGITREL